MAETTGRVLIVDDEANARSALAELLGDEGYDTDTAAAGEQALEMLDEFDPDVVLTDLKMPGIDGIELIQRGQHRAPNARFVVMTAFGTIDTAVDAIKQGAENYISKPLDFDAVSAHVGQACERAHLSRRITELRRHLHDEDPGARLLIGNHPEMQRLSRRIEQVGPAKANVLIEGESGTGKELVAKALHETSRRAHQPFVTLNCAALSESLLESELFGHERGAFTGAVSQHRGRFEQADKGTLFLDEVSEVPLPVQVKLLRFLQERKFERVGGNETLQVDVRIVAATNRDLDEQVREGRLREDLYYRLNVVKLHVPPLRTRKSDIPLLAHFFLEKHARENERKVRGFTDEAMRKLVSYKWPGNVRELENAVERAAVLCEGELVQSRHLPGEEPTQTNSDLGALVPGITLDELERMAIEQTLQAVDGSTAKAAELLGISQRKIQYRIKEWGLDLPSHSDH